MAELSHRPRHSAGSTIYDYPEHLNPFYEDENHKRLRFWSPKPAGYKSQRRGSLSSLRDGLRELWQYSSIRFGKKRSSTLGINKTSESPPPLRRDPYDLESSGASVSGYRSAVSESQSYTTTPLLFDRQTRYRSSLQPRSQANAENGFTRDNRYRSTIQNGFATYNSGMVTSTPRKKQAPQPYGTTPRVPQHHNSSNPFDDELAPDGDNLSTISMDDGYSSTLRSRTSITRTRNKRRAPPPPPVAVKPANCPDSGAEVNESQSDDLRNLTAEIASFVSSANGDEASRTPNTLSHNTSITEETRVDRTSDVNNNDARAEIPTTVSSIEVEIVQEDQVVVSSPKENTESRAPAMDEVKATTELQHLVESHSVQVEEPKPRNDEPAPVATATAAVETVNTSPKPIPRKKTETHQTDVVAEVDPVRKVDIDFENLALPETPVPIRRSNRERYITERAPPASKPVVLRADPKPPAASGRQEDGDDDGPTTTIIVDNLHYKLKVAPIHTEINSKIENARLKISESTGNIPAGATDNGTAERRRSVKDIIESINKSQSMLKVNLDPSGNGLHETQSTDSMTRNIRELNEREKEIANLLQDIDSRYGAAGGAMAVAPTGRGSYYDNMADDNLNDNLDDMNNMYAAPGNRVKKSPTKTVIIAQGDDQFQDCIDWNPVPKPRRTHIPGENVTGADQSPPTS